MDGYFEYQGGRIHYIEQGSGASIVLIHGYLETSETLAGFARKLSGSHRVITIDLPGHGLSASFDQIYTMEFMAQIVAALLDHLNIEKTIVAGHSLGGYITLAFAEKYSHRLNGYSLLHSQPLADNPDRKEKRNSEISLIGEGKKDTFIPGNISRLFAGVNLQKFQKQVKHTTDIALQIPADTIIKVLRGMIARPSRVHVMESGKVPLLWILGVMDNLIDYKTAMANVKLPDNASLHLLNDSGHMGFIEEEERVAEIISGFISDIQSRI